MNISYWVFIGIIYLAILTYQDYKHKMLVDDRFNYFMMGITISLISHIKRPLWIFIVYIIVLIMLYQFLDKNKALGGADLKTISWMFLGYLIINPFFLMVFAAILCTAALLVILLKKFVFKINHPTPFYGVLFIIFIFSNYLFKLYG